MTKFIDYRKSFCKHLDGTWDWDVPVWLTKAGLFSNCIIKSSPGKTFATQKEAEDNMQEVLNKLGIKKKK